MMFRAMALLFACLAVAACKEHKIEPTCSESVLVTERNGHKVRQTLSGVYIKADQIWGMSCESNPYSDNPQRRHFISTLFSKYYWFNGRLIGHADADFSKVDRRKAPFIELISNFQVGPPKPNPISDWWFHPAIPHQRYPIDLLPNFGLDQPDPNAGVGPILSKPTVYWAVRGTQSKRNGTPEVTRCSMRSPPNWDGKDYSPGATKERDPGWLIQAKTYAETTVGNTCRGYVSASNGKLAAMIDVPGAGLPEIDKIYQAVSQKLTDLTVE